MLLARTQRPLPLRPRRLNLRDPCAPRCAKTVLRIQPANRHLVHRVHHYSDYVLLPHAHLHLQMFLSGVNTFAHSTCGENRFG